MTEKRKGKKGRNPHSRLAVMRKNRGEKMNGKKE